MTDEIFDQLMGLKVHIEIPNLSVGDFVTGEVTLVKWVKKAGDSVAVGDGPVS
jgi:hypothetical protein